MGLLKVSVVRELVSRMNADGKWTFGPLWVVARPGLR